MTNSPIWNADYSEIADYLQAGDTWCLTSDSAVAYGIKKSFTQECRLPLILSLPQLLAAAACLPIDDKLLSGAALLEEAGESDSRLVWQLYDKLRPYCKTYSAAVRFSLAQKLARLFSEVEDYIVLPAGENPFAELQAEGGSHESQVAAAVWDILAEEKTDVLQQLAGVLPPFVAVCDEETTPQQRDFYQRCNACIAELAPSPAEQQWRQAFTLEGNMPPVEQYQIMQNTGATLSETAQLAFGMICEFLAQTEESDTIGIMVYDRLLARRLRAIAEVQGVLIADSKGWRAESLASGAALLVYAQLLLDEFEMDALPVVLAPPFYADDMTLTKAAAQWERQFSGALVLPTTMDELVSVCNAHCPALAVFMADIQQAREQAFAALRQLEHWVEWLYTSGAKILAAWRQDNIAMTLRARLMMRAAEHQAVFSHDEFLLWLKDTLAVEYISDNAVGSRVEFVAPSSKRVFAAVLLLGDAGKTAEDDGWLGQGEREQLKLPLRYDNFEKKRRQFCRILAAHHRLAAVWCAADSGGNPQLPNPMWQLFAEECRRQQRLSSLVLPPDESTADDIDPPPPARAIAGTLPAKLALTAADELMTCPYLFYSNRILALRDSDISPTDNTPPWLAGKLLHKVLDVFSKKSAALQSREELEECLYAIVMAEVGGNRPGLVVQRTYWLQHIPWLIDWELQRRQEGWRNQHNEYSVQMTMPLAAGGEVVLGGRIDRVDKNADGTVAIVDYKSGMLPAKKLLDIAEYPQLPLYAFFAGALLDAEISEKMLCRPLHRDSATVVSDAAARRVAARLRRMLRQVAAGAPLPANGTLSQCASCGAAGVCRREHWSS